MKPTLVALASLLGLALVVILMTACATALPGVTSSRLDIPSGSIPIYVQSINGCDGLVVGYNATGNPAEGEDFVGFYATPGSPPLAILEFDPGPTGDFKRGVVRIPGLPEQEFSNSLDFVRAYPHPCTIIGAAGIRT